MYQELNHYFLQITGLSKGGLDIEIKRKRTVEERQDESDCSKGDKPDASKIVKMGLPDETRIGNAESLDERNRVKKELLDKSCSSDEEFPDRSHNDKENLSDESDCNKLESPYDNVVVKVEVADENATEQPPPKGFIPTTIEHVNQLKSQAVEQATDRQTKWAVKLLKGK